VRYDNLQCLRAVAAAAVVLLHTPYYAHQRLGAAPAAIVTDPLARMFTAGLAVATFYALSGFVLTHALRSGSLRSFVGFRLLRLYPAYWAAFALTLAAHLAFDTLTPLDRASAAYLPRTRAFWQGVFLIPAGRGPVHLLGVEWTLIYEVCLSLGLAAAAAVAGRRRGLGIVVAVWLGLCLWKQATHPAGYNMPHFPRPAEWPLAVMNVPFLFGVLAYLTHERWGALRPWAPVAAALALAGSAVVPDAVGGWSNVLQGVAAALVIGYAATARQVAADHPLAVAGDWSYGVYLLHAPFLVVFFALSARHGWLPPTPAAAVFGGVLAFAVSAAFGAAEAAVYRKVRAVVLRRIRKPAVVPAPPPIIAKAA
jgi:peptidoglycan/LPS O-acetylase OafA/YrhL